MKDRGRVQTWALAAAGLCVVGAAAFGVRLAFTTKVKIPAGTGQTAVKVDANSSLRELSRAIARGDGMALAVLKTRLEAKPEIDITKAKSDKKDKPSTWHKAKLELEEAAAAETPTALTEAETADWVDALASLRVGFSRFSAYGRASAVVVTSEILQKFRSLSVPAGWVDSLPPSCEVFSAALADESWEVRVAALAELKSLWTWSPNRDVMKREIEYIADWKESFQSPVQARLNDKEAKVRMAAVACLGNLAINKVAEPAVRHINDQDGGVRLQVLISFAARPMLLTEEAILPLLYDSNSHVPPMAEQILKTRGLTPELLGLSKLVVNPRTETRMTAIPFLKDRQDIDPTVWLIFLSKDHDETVRLKAIEALATRLTPEAKKRLAEMAETDSSKAVRKAAEKLLPEGESTAELPPLPSPTPGVGMKLKAN